MKNSPAIALGLLPTYTGATSSWSGPGGFTSTLQTPSPTATGVARYPAAVTLGRRSSGSCGAERAALHSPDSGHTRV